MRYVEGLMNIKFDISIDIIEPIKANYETLAASKGINNNILRHININSVKSDYDLCIVATPSVPRAQIIKEICSETLIRAWVIEKVLATSIEDLKIIQVAIGDSPAWVNNTRRLTRLYKTLQSKLLDEPLKLKVIQKDFALGCNSIHYIDAISWLSGEPLDSIFVESKSLWFDSKRIGYKEFNGTVMAETACGSKLLIDNTGKYEDDEIILCQGENIARINEGKGFVWNNNVIATGRLEYQSELTAPLVEQIILNGNCSLPTLKASCLQHAMMLKAIFQDPMLSQNEERYIPIT
ncbi:hypothetical protein N9P15_02435 [Planktomarina sp.]|nr:hypothetical protein [Planktomarina sp.]